MTLCVEPGHTSFKPPPHPLLAHVSQQPAIHTLASAVRLYFNLAFNNLISNTSDGQKAGIKSHHFAHDVVRHASVMEDEGMRKDEDR